MATFAQYTVIPTDTFDERLYPEVISEVNRLEAGLSKFHSSNKVSIVISILKDHCIKTEWLNDNRQLAKLLTSGFLGTTHFEALFNSSRNNPGFISGLEAYITFKLA